MTADEIRKIDRSNEAVMSALCLREIAAQLAEANELKREEMALRKTGQANVQLEKTRKDLLNALLHTNRLLKEQFDRAANEGRKPHHLWLERIEKNDELLKREKHPGVVGGNEDGQ